MSVDIGPIRDALGGSGGETVTLIPSGVYGIDAITGGGLPLGRCVSIVGKGGVSKSTFLMSFLNKVCEYGGVSVLVDTDYSYTVNRAIELGHTTLAEQVVVMHDLKVDELFSSFKTILTTIARAPNYRFGVVAIDTFSNLPCSAELESGNPGIGLHARHSSLFFRNALGLLAKFNMTMIFVMHDKAKISTMPGVKMGYGYLAQNAIFANSFLEMHMVRTQGIKAGGSTTGFKVKVDIKKNKVAPPFRQVILDYYFAMGYDKGKTLLDGLMAVGLAKKSGGWYDVQGERLQASTLRNRPDLISDFEDMFYTQLKGSGVVSAPISDDEILDVGLGDEDEETAE